MAVHILVIMIREMESSEGVNRRSQRGISRTAPFRRVEEMRWVELS